MLQKIRLRLITIIPVQAGRNAFNLEAANCARSQTCNIIRAKV